MKETRSVYVIKPERHTAVFQIMDEMKIIMVKGIGYVVVNKTLENADTFRRIGEAIAQTVED